MDSTEQLWARIAQLEEKVHAMETGRRAQRTTVSDGFMRFVPGSGLAEIRVGSDDPDGNVALTVVDGNGNQSIGLGTRTDGTSYSEWRSGEGGASLLVESGLAGENVALTVTDTDGDQSIRIGTETDGSSVIDVRNGDGTASAFRIDSGAPAFPMAASAWMPNVFTTWVGNQPTVTSPSNWQILWSATVALTSDVIFFPPTTYNVDAATTCTFRVEAYALVGGMGPERPGHTAVWPAVVVAEAAGVTNATTGDIWAPDRIAANRLQIPAAIWDPAADPVGSMVRLMIVGQRTGGSGGGRCTPTEPVHCVERP